MNKSIIYALASSALVLATSCTDLDVDVKSKYTEYPTESEIALEAKMSDVYYAFRTQLGNNYNRTQTFASDEAAGISFDGDYYDSAENVNPTLHNFNPENKPLNYWADLASGITKCNQFIDDLAGNNSKAMQIAQARTMRAFYHFILMDSFGDVPVLDRVPDDGEAVERKPRAEVAAFIEKELKECLPILSDKNNAATYGKPNRWMAEALLRGAQQTNDDTPQSLLNQIRSYVHAPQFIGTPTLQDILDERGREFVDENWRRNDMIRFGTFENEYGFHRKGFPGARFDKSCRILPVPKAIMQENKNWKQNEGY